MGVLASIGVLLGGIGWLLAQAFGDDTVWRRIATLSALGSVALRVIATPAYADRQGIDSLTVLLPASFGLGAFSLGAAVVASGVVGAVRLPRVVDLLLDPLGHLPPPTNRRWLIGEVVSAAAVALAFGWLRPLASLVWGSSGRPGGDPWTALVVIGAAAVIALFVTRWPPRPRTGEARSDVRWAVRRVASALRRRVALVTSPIAWLVWRPLPDAVGTMLGVLVVAGLAVLVAWPTGARIGRLATAVSGPLVGGRLVAHFDDPWQAWETYHPDVEERDRQHRAGL